MCNISLREWVVETGNCVQCTCYFPPIFVVLGSFVCTLSLCEAVEVSIQDPQEFLEFAMDVAAGQQVVPNKFKDEVGQRCQKLFLDFLEW